MLKYVPKTRTKTYKQAPPTHTKTQNRIRHHRGTISVEKRYQWSRKSRGQNHYHSLQHVLVLFPTVHSSGLTVDPKDAVGLWSCSLREEHPTISALKPTTSVYRKIFTCTYSVAKSRQISNTVPPNVKPCLGISQS